MPINPITVAERLPTFVILGHSNADGWASHEWMMDAFPHLSTVAGGTVASRSSPVKNYYKNVYVATSAVPFPGVNHTPVASSVGTVQWLEMTANNPTSPAAPHPHASPYLHPNVRGSCHPNWYHYSWDMTGFTYWNDPANSADGVKVGIEVPLSWHLRHHWGGQIGVVKMAFSSTFMMALESGASESAWIDPSFGGPPAGWPGPRISAFTPADPTYYVRSATNGTLGGFHGWWTPKNAFDWAPSTDRLYKKWLDKMVGAAAALPAGVKMDVRFVIVWMGDNEAEGRALQALASFKEAARELRDKIRAALVSNDWTTLSEPEIPIIWPTVHSGYGTPEKRSLVNTALAELAADDPYMGQIDTDTLTVMSQEGYNPPVLNPGNHFSHTGYVQAAEAVFEKFIELEGQNFDAIAAEDRVTLQEVRNRVQTYYNRSRSATDTQDTDALDQHINAALDRILNDVGDNCWWLRRKVTLVLNTGRDNKTALPRFVARVVRIEDPLDVTQDVRFQQIGFVDGGRVQIHLNECPTGTSFTAHVITRPKRLTRADQLVPLPRQIVEWLVVEVCRRFARSGTNVTLLASLEGEARELRDRCIKDMQVTVRQRRDTLHHDRRYGYNANVHRRSAGRWN
jgi:hypothetical protein